MTENSVEHELDHALLERAGIRPTRQRLLVAGLLRGMGSAHATARQLYLMARARRMPLSLGTLYNTLNDLTRCGLLRRIETAQGSAFYAEAANRHHFLDEITGSLSDIPEGHCLLAAVPTPPAGMRVVGVDVIVRLRPEGNRREK